MKLTPQESKIAAHIATGRTTKMVSEDLHISPATVNNHKANIYRKLNVRNVGELSKWWFCNTFNIDPKEVDLRRSAGAIICLMLFILSMATDGDQAVRRARRRRRENEIEEVA